LGPSDTMADAGLEQLSKRLAAYCAGRMPGATGVRVSGLQRIFGGASRETWRFVLHHRSQHKEVAQPLILRRDPGASLIDTERRIEYGAYQAFAGSRVPVPRVLWLEESSAALDHPFFIMEEITGCEAGPLKLMADPYRAHHGRIAQQKWAILGEIARTDTATLQPMLAAVGADRTWARELDHWAGVIERESLEPQPIVLAALRWLRAHPPPPAQRIGVGHGDFRTGNLLIDPEGEIRAVLDWEMMHLGDPLEDLAWGLNRVWCFQPDRVGGLVPHDEAVDIWARASGLRADPAALHWWELFSCVKGQAIWLTAARTLERGANRDLIMAIAAWMMTNSQDRAILELMGRLH